MKATEVKVGGRYIAKVSDTLTRVRIREPSPHGRGWIAVNETTGRDVRIKTAGKLRKAVR